MNSPVLALRLGCQDHHCHALAGAPSVRGVMRVSHKLFCVLVVGVPGAVSTLSVSHTTFESNAFTLVSCRRY